MYVSVCLSVHVFVHVCVCVCARVYVCVCVCDSLTHSYCSQVKCRGTRVFATAKGAHMVDHILRTHYFPVTTIPSSAALLGDLSPNMKFVCEVKSYCHSCKITSTTLNFTTKPAGQYSIHYFIASYEHAVGYPHLPS